MTYSLLGQELGRDPRWWALAEHRPEGEKPFSRAKVLARRHVLRSVFMVLQCDASTQKDDGYVTRQQVIECCDGELWVLDALTRSVLGRKPFLHQPGQQCAVRNCIDNSPPWREGFDFRICGFLKKNPSRAEQERQAAKNRDSKDPVLRNMVYERDGGCCRYCRSGPLKRKGMGNAKDKRRVIEFDHPNPDSHAEGGANLVVSCRRCNLDKSDNDILRTPDEADMALLPVPSAELKAWWRQRGEQRFDRPPVGQSSPADIVPDNDNDNASNNVLHNAPDNEHGAVETVVPGVVHDAPQATVEPVEAPRGPQEQRPALSAEVSNSGRVGAPPAVPVLGPGGQPVRTPDAPDVWTRRSRTPAHDPPAGGDP